jgi:transcription elongation factor SPT6
VFEVSKIHALFNIVQDGHGVADDRDQSRKGPQAVEKIKKALDLMRNQHFEVPFIAFYRKEYVEPELNISDLWRVYRFDEKVCYFVVFFD